MAQIVPSDIEAAHLGEAPREVGREAAPRQAGGDTLDRIIGGTEENIAAAFCEAVETDSMLTFDEVDGFQPNFATAHRHWEITRVNQLLTVMEEFDGILVCATNLKKNLDPATMRRVDFKIHFEYLLPGQAMQVTEDLLAVLESPFETKVRMRLRPELAAVELSYGDFAVLLRRYAALNTAPDSRQLVADLKSETSFRESTSPPIGFLAGIEQQSPGEADPLCFKASWMTPPGLSIRNRTAESGHSANPAVR